MVETGHPDLSIVRQCELLELARPSYYYRQRPVNELNLGLMRKIDEIYMDNPFFGGRRMTAVLKREGYEVNHKRIERLMRLMGIEAIYPKPKLSVRASNHKIYPYLLKGVVMEKVDQVWSTDITYLPMPKGFVYLVAVMDWYSRYILSWEISVTMEVDFCLDALDRALKISKPEIFNTDQGSQFTSLAFTGQLLEAGITISMDGRGRCFDNIWIERFWRDVKWEDVYLNDYQNVEAVLVGLAKYIDKYNHYRPHQALDYRTPAEVYFQGLDGRFTSRLFKTGG